MRVIADLILARSNKWHPSNFFGPSLEIIHYSFANRPKVCVESSPSTKYLKSSTSGLPSFMVMGPDARAKPNGHWESAFLGFLLKHTPRWAVVPSPYTWRGWSLIHIICAPCRRFDDIQVGVVIVSHLYCFATRKNDMVDRGLGPSVPWLADTVHIVIKGGCDHPLERRRLVIRDRKGISWGEWMDVFCAAAAIRLSAHTRCRSTSLYELTVFCTYSSVAHSTAWMKQARWKTQPFVGFGLNCAELSLWHLLSMDRADYWPSRVILSV